MCLIFLSINDHPDYRLIVAANRDEFYARRTSPAHFWQDHPEVLAGRDLEASGTWMGITKTGRIAMVTNYRDPAHLQAGAPSRGTLVADFLTGSGTPDDYLQGVQKTGAQYNGFNLIVGDAAGLYYYSNYRDGISKIEDGFHGLSNHLLETPWPKLVRGKEKLGPILNSSTPDPDRLLDALYDTIQSPEEQLPDTGIGRERERALSSMFIKTPNYGTRCSTVVMFDRKGAATFVERTFDTTTFVFETRRFEIRFGENH